MLTFNNNTIHSHSPSLSLSLSLCITVIFWVEFLLRLTTIHTSAVAEAAVKVVYNRTSIMAGAVVDKKFPGDFLVPKHETGVIQFLKKYPNYNGDGVTIAILDSGVDPKASGLEVS